MQWLHLMMLTVLTIQVRAGACFCWKPSCSDEAGSNHYIARDQVEMFGVSCILIGLLLTFTGNSEPLYNRVLSGIVFFSAVGIIVLASSESGKDYNDRYCFVTYFLAIWLGGGSFARNCPKIGTSIIGGLGFVGMSMFALSWNPDAFMSPKPANLILMGLIMSMGAWVIHMVDKPITRIIIPSNALIGSYLFMIGVDIFAKTGLAQALYVLLGSQKTPFEVTPGYRGLLGSMIPMFLLGILVQHAIEAHRNQHSPGTIQPLDSNIGRNEGNLVRNEALHPGNNAVHNLDNNTVVVVNDIELQTLQ